MARWDSWSVALEAGCELAERPDWDEILGGSAHRLSSGGGDAVIPTDAPLGAACLRHSGGLILASAGALWEGWAVHRHDPDGHQLSHPPLPVGRPTCPAFGARELDGPLVPSGGRE